MHFPTDLNEWKSWTERLGTKTLYYKQDFVDASNALSDSVIEELGWFYTKALRRKDLKRIDAWLRSESGVIPMSDDEKAIRNLVELFGHLGQREYSPFDSQAMTLTVEA